MDRRADTIEALPPTGPLGQQAAARPWTAGADLEAIRRRATRQQLAEAEEEALARVSWPTYAVVFAVLVGLTLLTWSLSYASFGPASLPIALVIAVTKATLVVF